MDVFLLTATDSQAVLATLSRSIDRYGFASVSDLKSAIAQPKTITYGDHKIGWANLSDVTVSQIEDGYQISLPDPIKEVDVLTDRIVEKIMTKLRDQGIVLD